MRMYDVPGHRAFKLKKIFIVSQVISKSVSHAGDTTHCFFVYLKEEVYEIGFKGEEVTNLEREKLITAINTYA